MASTSTTLYSPSLSCRAFLNHHYQPKRVSTTMVRASRNEADHNQNHHSYHHGGGRIVDENLIVLRKRIHEMKMVERNYEPPSDWMDWEKNCYAGYDEFICEAMGLLQSRLMNTRPSFVLAMAVLVGLSVPASTALVLFHLTEMMTNEVLAGVVHLNF